MEFFPLGHGMLERQRHLARRLRFVEHQFGAPRRADATDADDLAHKSAMTGRMGPHEIRRGV